LQLFDLKANDFDDLRESLNPENRNIVTALEAVTKERDSLRKRIDHL